MTNIVKEFENLIENLIEKNIEKNIEKLETTLVVKELSKISLGLEDLILGIKNNTIPFILLTTKNSDPQELVQPSGATKNKISQDGCIIIDIPYETCRFNTITSSPMHLRAVNQPVPYLLYREKIGVTKIMLSAKDLITSEGHYEYKLKITDSGKDDPSAEIIIDGGPGNPEVN